MATPVYNQIGGLSLYVLAPDAGMPTNCWAGYLPGAKANFGINVYPYQTWQDDGGVYLFLKETPSDFPSFLQGLNQLLPRISPNREARILWIHNPNYPDSTYWQWNMLKASASQSSDKLKWVVARQANFNIGGYAINIQAGTTMDLDDEFSCDITFAVDQVSFFGPNGIYPAQGNQVSIPLWGENTGAWSCYLNLKDSDFSALRLMLRYATTSALNNSNPFTGVETIDAPLINSSTGVQLQMQLSFDPLNPIDPRRTYLDFFPYDSSSPPALQSTFMTRLGYPISLTPKYSNSRIQTARLVFNSVPSSYTNAGDDSYADYYLVPNGGFSMTPIYPPSIKTTPQLLCGLSGVEYIEFSDGDIMMFNAGQPAGVDVSVLDSSSAQLSFKFSDSAYYTTSHVLILPNSAQLCNYYSEANNAPFFINNSPEDAKNLDYYPLSLLNLTNITGELPNSNFFPLLPYSGITKATIGFGSSTSYTEDFEFQLLNPTRQKVIEATATAPAGGPTSTTYSLTPQGYQATFVNGVWAGISITQAKVMGGTAAEPITVSSVDIEFGSTSQAIALPAALQKAFLTNQQFLVMSANINDNLSCFNASIMMSEWCFGSSPGTQGGSPILIMPATTTPGEYKNIIIFKSANTTVKEMVRNPQLWTQYEAFNDTTSDSDGNFLSNWLIEYLKNAEDLYDGGNGDISFESFCTLINSKEWNGFLILKVEVGDIATLPVDVQALTADISGGLYAHHLGNEINHVKPSVSVQGSYDINSPFFGLIHYVNPNFAAQIQHLPAYVQNAADYNFTVLTLEVTFEKNLEKSFSNKSMLLINKFFGDDVLQTGPNGEQGANNLILIGTYHQVDNVPTYSFSTAQGITTNFYLASNAFNCNRISNVTMNVVKDNASTPDDEIYNASFAIRGNFDFLNDGSFDLLSYEYLPYYGVSIDVRIERVITGVAPDQVTAVTNTYSMDASKLNFDKNLIEALPAGSGAIAGQALTIVRTGSLMAQFPMKLKGLVRYVDSVDSNNKPNNASPADIGYRLLETATPKGISFPSPANGAAWYGLEFDLILGGKGSLASIGAISASVILAWTPGGSGGFANASPQFKLSGPDGVSLSFDFESVLKFGAKGIMLNRYIGKGSGNPSYFYLVFQSIALTILGISFPPGDTTNIVLMGDTSIASGDVVKPTLSWFGGYAEKMTGGGS